MNGFVIAEGVLIRYTGMGGDVIVPDGIRVIGDSAFSDCAALRHVTLPDSLLHIGAYAFYDCIGLEAITVPFNTTQIGAEAFSGCVKLIRVTLPVALSHVGMMAFAFCPALTFMEYRGSKTDWQGIRIDAYNDCLLTATHMYESE